jgi:DNA-binding transcriptional ArsR family regulator
MTVVPVSGDAPAAQVNSLGGAGQSTRDEAESRAERIRSIAHQAVEDVLTLLEVAYQRRDWLALGHADWQTYVRQEFVQLPKYRDAVERKRIVAQLDEAGLTTRAIAAVTGTSQPTVLVDLGKSTDRNLSVGAKKGLDGKRRPNKAAAKNVRKEELAELKGIRQDGDEHKYQAMLAAPPGAINRPLIDRAEKIEDLLGDLCALSPEDAATMMPANRCREFTINRARWWLDFTEHCEKRRDTETPQLPPLKRWTRNAANNPVLIAAGKIPPEAERELSGQARAALDWLREHDDWATQATIGIGIGAASSSLGNCLRMLTAAGLLEIARDGRTMCYRRKSPQ